MITLEEAKAYLRVDSDYDDAMITVLRDASEKLCMDVARLSKAEWAAICEATEEDVDYIEIRAECYPVSEILRMRELVRVAVLYALGYLYEHREQADYHDLTIMLSHLLFSIREGVF